MHFNVLLISCYELGHQPLGLASPAAHVLAEGLPVQCMDLSVEHLDEEKVRSASFIGISVPMHTAIRLGIKVAERVRKINKKCHICFYGLYASLNEKYLLETYADSVVGGEYEESLRNLLRYLTGKPVEHLSGVSTRSHRSGPLLGRQQFLPPARHLLPPLERYARLDLGLQQKLVGSVEASRGCAHRCLHCPITPVYEGRMRIIQEEVVLTDVRNLVVMGAEHISFYDPDFLNGVNHSMRIAHRMHDEFPRLTFDMTAKIEHIVEYHDLIPELRELGCIFIQSAVESLNNTILDYLDKGHSKADVLKALKITQMAGVALRPSFVSFTPWTTLEDYLEVLEFIEEHDLVYHVDPVQFAIRLLLPPGSSLLETSQISPFIGELDAEKFSYEWKHPNPKIEVLRSNVTQAVEWAAKTSEDPTRTFSKIKELALSAMAGRWISVPDLPIRPSGSRPPRLTESWFCCAEPTQDQLLPITSTSQGVVI
jgi:radical SAM superfamily enzyme YgiQ (UPF0313 family)